MVGLVLVTYKDNFGSALQSYATQEYIRKLGYDTGIFNIDGVHGLIKRRKVRFYLTRLANPDELKYVLSKAVSKLKNKSKADKYARQMAVRHRKYIEFYNEYFDFLPDVSSWEELTVQASECESVVVGSDQLWRPSNIVGRFYTLEFVPDGISKTAYATSFGVSSLPKSLHRQTKSFLGRIDNVSTRELSGARLVKLLTGRRIPVVCDPTMLLTAEEWMRIQKPEPIIEGRYILCYFLGDNPLHRRFAKRLKRAAGCRIVGLLHGSTYIKADENFADIAPFDIGPSEFVNLIRNAEYICTDSFHAAVFSLINSKKFFAFKRFSDRSGFSTNDRLHTLLSWTGLSDRLLEGNESIENALKMEIDYDDVQRRIAENRRRSAKYLEKALKSSRQ